MIKSLTNSQQGVLRGLTAGLFALMLAVFAMPAQAQMDDGELPKIDFSVNLAQHAQYLTVDRAADTDAVMGFQRVRAGLNASVQFSENVNGLLMLEQEPNDFGFNVSTPAVDFAILNVQATDQLTIQAGTPVTGLMNFRGFSDGPAVQGNPLVLNSPADMITAGQGVKLIGSYDTFGFDLTVARGFGGAVTSSNPSDTPPSGTAPDNANDQSGVEVIGKVRYTGSDMFKVGAGAAVGTGRTGLNFAGGDGDNIDFGDYTSPASATRGAAHAAIPGKTVLHADAKLMLAGADIDLWGGYGSNSDADIASAFGGIGLKYPFNDSFYGAGRYTVVSNQSDGADEDSPLGRLQLGLGYEIYNKALLKVEYFRQTEPAGSPGNIGNTWQGVITELSFNF